LSYEGIFSMMACHV